MVQRRTPEWSNVPGLGDMDAELRTQTPEEARLAKKAEEVAKIPPVRYDVTSKNTKAMRVIHDYNGGVVSIPPGQTRLGVLLLPDTATHLNRGDLALTESPAAAPA